MWNRTLWTLINPVLSSQLDESGIRVLTLVAMLTTVTLSVGVVTVVEHAERQVVTPVVLVKHVIGVARADIFNGTALIRMWHVLNVKMSDIMPVNVKPKMWKWVNHITNLRNSRFITLLNQNPIIPVMRHFTFFIRLIQIMTQNLNVLILKQMDKISLSYRILLARSQSYQKVLMTSWKNIGLRYKMYASCVFLHVEQTTKYTWTILWWNPWTCVWEYYYDAHSSYGRWWSAVIYP